ncbi:hypothetical protein K435DRAFT_655869 [Dendrothele bispora CBS 962.96]|uniref:Uncharacterized protein n=1 Tax=Dendrothele bispora (strain CBS 962.96) TaxID=1314807 RepID=A0A4S8MG86_DENBC|nr:hypothetical protein K435DRAFT_655869 [Dendrothele bispora CBS 962.96]
MCIDIPQPSPLLNHLLRHLPSDRNGIHVTKFGGCAGEVLPGSTAEPHCSGFQRHQSKLSGSEDNLWAPFTSRVDWEVARCAKMQGTGSTAFTDLLSIDGVYEALGLSYRNSQELNSIIDHSLPAHRPSFTRQEIVVAGKAIDLYKRDIMECIQALYGNPDHCQYLCFSPERHYTDADKLQRLYHDMYTGKWWWSTQEAIEKDKPGGTIIPIILSSDKTQVTLFRNKSAYPVYLTIGNLPREIRRKPSQQGQVLLAYLPTDRLEHVKNKASRRRTITNLFHACMTYLLAPLKKAGLEGVVMRSGDGVQRRCHPILAAYVGDYPKQVLVTGIYSGDCASCETEKDELNVYPCPRCPRDGQRILEAVKAVGSADWAEKCLEQNVKPVQHPFWEDLPYADIFRSITPDILHQMYQGVMKHLISWLTQICGDAEVDARVRRLPANHSIRIFHKGITSLSRVTGTEHKQMCSFLLGIVTDIPSLTTAQSNQLLSATRALLDFLYLSCYSIHTHDSLDSLDTCLATFHSYRQIFVELGVQEHFNLPKLHFLSHYTRAIKLFGTTDNYNTETTERLHIDFAKTAYRASNYKDEYPQMTRWLEQREKIQYHTSYVAWRLQRLPSSNSSSSPIISAVTLADMQCLFTVKLSRFPTMKSVPLTKLEDTTPNGYNATQFTTALKRFIIQFHDPDLSSGQIDDYMPFLVLPFTRLPVWHKMKFVNEELYGKETLDSISARPRRINNKVVQASQFDAALIKVRGNINDGANMRISHVRVIFSFGNTSLDLLFPPNINPPSHLAYVEWFTKLTATPDPYSGLHRVKRQMSSGLPAASIIPVEKIRRSAHLLPKWGGAVPSEWRSETVLDLCDTFWLNPFKDNHSYFNLT